MLRAVNVAPGQDDERMGGGLGQGLAVDHEAAAGVALGDKDAVEADVERPVALEAAHLAQPGMVYAIEQDVVDYLN